MNEQIRKIANETGMTLIDSSVWTKVVERFARALIDECTTVVKEKTDTTHAYTTFDLNMIQATIGKSASAIQEHFGDKHGN